jgi:hypothetical protein
MAQSHSPWFRDARGFIGLSANGFAVAIAQNPQARVSGRRRQVAVPAPTFPVALTTCARRRCAAWFAEQRAGAENDRKPAGFAVTRQRGACRAGEISGIRRGISSPIAARIELFRPKSARISLSTSITAQGPVGKTDHFVERGFVGVTSMVFIDIDRRPADGFVTPATIFI